MFKYAARFAATVTLAILTLAVDLRRALSSVKDGYSVSIV
jgi:hypothetical protein